MTTATTPPPSSTGTPTPILRLLDRLRSLIRRYVLAEGVAMSVIWLVVAFWGVLAMDYLPVLLGANEMPKTARIVLLVGTSAVWLLIVYWFVLRRVFCTFRNSSLALLIERQFPDFHDSLVTTVQMDRELTDVDQRDRKAVESALDASDVRYAQSMLSDTVEDAAERVRRVQLGRVFDYRPLVRKVVGALVAVSSIVLLGVFGGDVLGVGVSRLIGLSEDPWPRRARIEMVGFLDGVQKIAKGTDTVIRVRADANRDDPPPELCSILYRTAEGDSGRVNMSRDGEPREGFQYYVFNGKPFKGVLNDIQFDVIGFDYRIRDQRLQVVLSPVVTSIELTSRFPDYLQQEPRVETWHPGLQLPIGTQITAKIHSSKSLVAASILDVDTGEESKTQFGSMGQTSWDLDLGMLQGRQAISLRLHDTDGIESLEPHLLTIGAVEDLVPSVDVSLRGIGSAITPDARLPIEGTIQDDYELERTWFHVVSGQQDREFDFPLPSGNGRVTAALDLREEAAAAQQNPLQLKPEDRLVFGVQATDRFDLDGQSHVGSSESLTLSVVRSDELLAILDGRELGLRRRFEQIRGEMLQSRDSLARLRGSFDISREETVDEDAGLAANQNLFELRERWASWAGQKGEQTTAEVEGIALAFEDIREELVNNRVDTPERKLRLESQIIAPLRMISAELLVEWREDLEQLRARLRAQDVEAEASSIRVVQQADAILAEMDRVLEKMLELEDYAELVNLIRQIIDQQEKLLEKTKAEQKSKVLEFLD